jgi:hypothetical protein
MTKTTMKQQLKATQLEVPPNRDRLRDALLQTGEEMQGFARVDVGLISEAATRAYWDAVANGGSVEEAEDAGTQTDTLDRYVSELMRERALAQLSGARNRGIAWDLILGAAIPLGIVVVVARTSTLRGADVASLLLNTSTAVYALISLLLFGAAIHSGKLVVRRSETGVLRHLLTSAPALQSSGAMIAGAAMCFIAGRFALSNAERALQDDLYVGGSIVAATSSRAADTDTRLMRTVIEQATGNASVTVRRIPSPTGVLTEMALSGSRAWIEPHYAAVGGVVDRYTGFRVGFRGQEAYASFYPGQVETASNDGVKLRLMSGDEIQIPISPGTLPPGVGDSVVVILPSDRRASAMFQQLTSVKAAYRAARPKS